MRKLNSRGIFFLGVCIVLATLLLARVVTVTVGSILFAVALASFGILNAFREKPRKSF